jgi:hypothetical protein
LYILVVGSPALAFEARAPAFHCSLILDGIDEGIDIDPTASPDAGGVSESSSSPSSLPEEGISEIVSADITDPASTVTEEEPVDVILEVPGTSIEEFASTKSRLPEFAIVDTTGALLRSLFVLTPLASSAFRFRVCGGAIFESLGFQISRNGWYELSIGLCGNMQGPVALTKYGVVAIKLLSERAETQAKSSLSKVPRDVESFGVYLRLRCQISEIGSGCNLEVRLWKCRG